MKKAQTKIRGGTLLQNAVNAIGKYEETVQKSFNIAVHVLDVNDDEANLAELETLVNEIISASKVVNEEARKFIEWTKTDKKKLIDLELISLIITSMNVYINSTNIDISYVSTIKDWEIFKNSNKSEKLFEQLFGKDGPIEQYKNAVGELIEVVRNNWSLDEFPKILEILGNLSKTVNKLGVLKSTDLAYQILREFAEAEITTGEKI